jgi:hypothetical protein
LIRGVGADQADYDKVGNSQHPAPLGAQREVRYNLHATLSAVHNPFRGRSEAMPTAFISYSHHDHDFVQRLARDLERAGLDVCWDKGVLLRAGCQQRCDCGWLSGPVYCGDPVSSAGRGDGSSPQKLTDNRFEEEFPAWRPW